MSTLTPDAKDALRRTIRGLRERLATELRAEAESTYALGRADAGDLPESIRERRARLLAHVDEHVRSAPAAELKKNRAAVRERVLRGFVLEAAHTLVNRLVLLRHMEALSVGRPRAERLVPIEVVTKGWQSLAYTAFREHAAELCTDATEGYATLLRLVFDELAEDLPGLYGDVGLTRLFPIPPATLRAVVEALNDPALDSAWTDDTTLGWVYQYWNDPERERLDKKLADGGKVEPHEIASKTQMFTERYMVEWLLQNSLGLTWLAMCRKHGWRPDAADVLDELDARRADWRSKREAGEVALDALMPIHGPLEDRWKYWVPQPIPDDAVEKAPRSIREVRLLDPACGSGHFLVIAFDLLAALYQEEARHRGEAWTAKDIATSIVENNLHGVDIDPRAVQIAAAGLYVKWRSLAHDARPKQVNLVAPSLHLGRLPADDPALVELGRSLADEAGVPEAVTTRLVSALAGVDHLGSLLKIDAAIEDALKPLGAPRLEAAQGDLWGGMPAAQARIDFAAAKETVLDRIERFLARHGAEGDLGLRLDGEEIAAGVRFVRMMKEGTFDVVVGNPPYQGTTKMVDAAYVAKQYPAGKADLFAAFVLRGLELARHGGHSSMVTMKGWMFLGQLSGLREQLLDCDLRLLGDVGWGAFAEMTDNPVVLSIVRAAPPSRASVALCPTHPTARVRTDEHYRATVTGLLAQVGRHEFQPRSFRAICGEPVVYWWGGELLEKYSQLPKLGEKSPGLVGLRTSDNVRFVRYPWECRYSSLWLRPFDEPADARTIETPRFVPYIKGARGRVWFDDTADVAQWYCEGLPYLLAFEHKYQGFTSIQNRAWYFRPAIAFAMIGNEFSARAHRFRSIVGHKGASVFRDDVAQTVCLMNSARARFVLESLNPGIGFEVGDVNRLPIFPVESADEIFATLDRAFTEHEAAREASVEFKRPGPSPWRSAQDWAQRAVDRAAGEPLPPYEPSYDPPAPEAALSFAFGVALGRFGAHGEGVLDEAPASALPGGILFVSAASREHDSLAHPACGPLHEAWAARPAGMTDATDLGEYLRKAFFAGWVKPTYENRPIYLPLSSEKKSFVAWVSIHRWRHDTLQVLLAEHLRPEATRLEGQLADLGRARGAGGAASAKERTAAERRYREVQRLADELDAFIKAVRAIAEAGPPKADDRCPPREVDARFAMDLDDGVMVNGAALWPLLDPQWKDPKKWWKELATAEGRKDYDWAHLAARYFPKRVDAKCKEDPSLAVAHGCFWKYHPAKAYAWELRLQDEIREGFTIDEAGSDEARVAFLKGNAGEARAIEAAEMKRRERKAAKKGEEDGAELPFEGGDGDDEASSDGRVGQAPEA